MLKKTVKYEDFDGNQDEETLYFNLSKSEIMSNLWLNDDLANIRDQLSKLETSETDNVPSDLVQQIIDLVKKIMKLSYGIRHEDKKRFIKSDDIWTEFTQTAAYDALLFSLFDNPQEAVDFMQGVLPQDLVARVNQESEYKALLDKANLSTGLADVISNVPQDEVVKPIRPKVPLDHLQNPHLMKPMENPVDRS